MASYVLSRRADTDIKEIAERSVRDWGIDRAERYIREMHETFAKLADLPAMGKDVSFIRPGYLQFRSESHLVFYQAVSTGIMVVRVLHERVDVARVL